MQPVTVGKVNRKLTLLLRMMATSFALIHSDDGKLSMPLLAWAGMGLFTGSVGLRITCFLVLAAWLYLGIAAFSPGARRNGVVAWASLGLGLIVSVVVGVQFTKPLNSAALWV